MEYTTADFYNAVVSFFLVLITVWRISVFVRKSKKSGAMIWSELGEGLFISMALVLGGQVLQVTKYFLVTNDMHDMLVIGATSFYLLAATNMAVYVWRSIDRIKEVMG